MSEDKNSTSKGKRYEYVVVAELLKRGFDVYMPIIDDKQIDCVIRIDINRYIDIQIKGRGKDIKNPGQFSQLKIVNPRKNYFFIFYNETLSTYWIIPSSDVVENGNQIKSGKDKGKYKILLVDKDSIKILPKWQSYKNNFDLLKGAS